MNFDFFIFQQINQFASENIWIDILGIFFAKYSGYILVTLLFFGFLFFRKRFKEKKEYGLMIVEAILAGLLARLVIANIIRMICFRARPFVSHSVNLLLNHNPGSSFPSGHASFFFALSFVIYFFNKRAGILFLFVSLLMGLARIFVGIHYPFDILGGFFVGIISAWLTDRYLKGYIKRVFR